MTRRGIIAGAAFSVKDEKWAFRNDDWVQGEWRGIKKSGVSPLWK